LDQRIEDYSKNPKASLHQQLSAYSLLVNKYCIKVLEGELNQFQDFQRYLTDQKKRRQQASKERENRIKPENHNDA
jgi:hypothetical protein